MTLSISKGFPQTHLRFGKIAPGLKAQVQGPSQFNTQWEKIRASGIPALLRELDLLSLPPVDIDKLQQQWYEQHREHFPYTGKDQIWFELTHKNQAILGDKSERDELDPETKRQIQRILLETQLTQYVEGLNKARHDSPYLASEIEQRVSDLIAGIEQLQHFTLQPESALAKALVQFKQEPYIKIDLSPFRDFLGRDNK